MLYTLKAPLFGQLFVGADDIGHMKARRNDVVVELRTSRLAQPGMAVLIEEVAISTRVPPNKLDHFILEVGQEPIPGGVLSELRERFLLEMQTFESGFAFAYGDEFPIEKVAWERWIEEFTPETDAERAKLNVNRVGVIRPASEQGAVVEVRHLRHYFERADRYMDLNIPLAFFREGMNAYKSERFVAAFHSFYFIVEDLFADGKFKQDEVLKAFNRSDLLKDVLQEVIDQLTDDPAHDVPFRRLFGRENIPDVNVDGFMRLLFKLRGGLHHYSSKNPKTQGTPFNEAEFRIAAHTLLMISGLSIRLKMMELDKQIDPDGRPGIDLGRLLS